MDYFWEKLVFHKASLLMTPCYDVTISGKERFIKLEWVVQLRYVFTFEFPFQIAFKQDQKTDRSKIMSVAL